MKKSILTIIALLAYTAASAIDKNTVEIVYSGTKATVSVASNISSYITNQSSGAHVRLIQGEGVDASVGEITYILSGTSTDGEFYLEGSYKATLSLAGLTLSNPSGPALNLQDGKRMNISAKNGTTNTLADGNSEEYKGCIHVKGHTELKGKGTLNIKGNSRHAIYSKEYVEVKNISINITGAQKDGIHCQEYFLMESGTLSISNTGDDGIQVEQKDAANATGTTTDHEDEDSGNFYQLGGTLNISSYAGKAIKTDGTISHTGGTWSGFSTANTEENVAAGISSIEVSAAEGSQSIYDLNGRRMDGNAQLPRGVYIVRNGRKTVKTVIK